MRRSIGLILLLCLLLAFPSCSHSHVAEPIGDDWHVWGMYDFVSLGDKTVAIGKAYDADKVCIGYHVYADGASQGPLLGELRFADGGLTVEDFDSDNCLVFQDHDQDGHGDIGIMTRDGDILWYLWVESAQFSYTERQNAEIAIAGS